MQRWQWLKVKTMSRWTNCILSGRKWYRLEKQRNNSPKVSHWKTREKLWVDQFKILSGSRPVINEDWSPRDPLRYWQLMELKRFPDQSTIPWDRTHGGPSKINPPLVNLHSHHRGASPYCKTLLCIKLINCVAKVSSQRWITYDALLTTPEPRQSTDQSRATGDSSKRTPPHEIMQSYHREASFRTIWPT